MHKEEFMVNNVILSIHPQYAQQIEVGNKIYEVRTRKINLEKGTRIWIYKTLPEACIDSFAEIDDVLLISPQLAWKKYSSQMCISKAIYNSYVQNKKEICLLKLKNVKKTNKKITLKELRKKIPPFFPPQFFKKLNPNEEILQALENLLK